MATLNEFDGQDVQALCGDRGTQDVRTQYVSAKKRPAARTARQDSLRQTIEQQIIPRLMLLNGASGSMSTKPSERHSAVSPSDVEKFTGLLLSGDQAEPAAFIDAAVQGGASQSAILLDLLSPAARRLGEMWEDDTYSFAEVTIAMGALQRCVHQLQAAWLAKEATSAWNGRTVVLSPAAGEQHWFAIQVLESFFLRSRWQVDARLAYDRRGLMKTLSKQHVDALGLSIGRDALLDQLSSDIDELRGQSRNRSIVILVGGSVFVGRPELARKVGADGTADDASAAVALAQRLVMQGASIGV